jgi:Ca2+/Na+ antiporter
MFPVNPAVLHPDVPDTVYNMVGDYNFLRNAGFAFTPLAIILGIWGILKLLSVPEINRFKKARVWCRDAMEKRFKFAVLLEWVFLFITNTVFFAFLQLRDYNIYDTFAQVGLVFAHFFILFFVVVSVMVAYKVISFQKEHPQMSENIKKASEIILQDN